MQLSAISHSEVQTIAESQEKTKENTFPVGDFFMRNRPACNNSSETVVPQHGLRLRT